MCAGLMFFASLGLGYGLCVLANKEKGNLRVLGFSLGISIIALTLLFGLVKTYAKQCPMMDKMSITNKMCDKMMKCGPMGKMRQ